MNTLTDEQRERILALLRSGKTLRRIEDETGHRRETIAAYGRRAGLLDGAPAPLDAWREPQSMFEPHRARIERDLADGETLRDIHTALVREFAIPGSYSALKRFVRLLPARRSAGPLMLAA